MTIKINYGLVQVYSTICFTSTRGLL